MIRAAINPLKLHIKYYTHVYTCIVLGGSTMFNYERVYNQKIRISLSCLSKIKQENMLLVKHSIGFCTPSLTRQLLSVTYLFPPLPPGL